MKSPSRSPDAATSPQVDAQVSVAQRGRGRLRWVDGSGMRATAAIAGAHDDSSVKSVALAAALALAAVADAVAGVQRAARERAARKQENIESACGRCTIPVSSPHAAAAQASPRFRAQRGAFFRWHYVVCSCTSPPRPRNAIPVSIAPRSSTIHNVAIVSLFFLLFPSPPLPFLPPSPLPPLSHLCVFLCRAHTHTHKHT